MTDSGHQTSRRILLSLEKAGKMFRRLEFLSFEERLQFLRLFSLEQNVTKNPILCWDIQMEVIVTGDYSLVNMFRIAD